MSTKLKRKSHRNLSCEEKEMTRISLGCLTLYGKTGGCKVGVDTGEEFGITCSRRQFSACEEGKRYNLVCGYEEETINCFSNGMEKVFRKKNRTLLTLNETQPSNRVHMNFAELLTLKEEPNNSMNTHLPDDILEMCLIRLPLTSLMNARLVCKKWRNLTTTPRFIQIRKEESFRTPWLFLFGFVKDGYCSGEIHTLDVSLNRWHKIDSQIIKGRFRFSVGSVHDAVYVVGGCSSLTNPGKMDHSSSKTHKGVLVFSPLTKTWRKAASMKYARSSPILGISEVTQVFLLTKSRRERRLNRLRVGGESDVYEDPHRLSVRRRQTIDENDISSIKFSRQKDEGSSSRKGASTKFFIIAVGGVGCWDEPLDTSEIYDSATNKWTEIQRMPLDFGVACTGAVCNGIFYVYSESDKLIGYHIEKGYWMRIQTNSCPARVHEYHPKLISCASRLFMLSVSWCEGDGQIGKRNKAVRKLWEIDLTKVTWTQLSVHPDAPMDCNAEFVAGEGCIFGVEMFKILGQVLDFVTMLDVSHKGGTKWSHISRNHVAQDLDASSCMSKSMALLQF